VIRVWVPGVPSEIYVCGFATKKGLLAMINGLEENEEIKRVEVKI